MKFIFASLLISLLPAATSLNNPGDNVRMNRIQVIGSHNSYKQSIDPKLFKMLQARDSVAMSKIDYSHSSLTDQLNLGLLDLEIDVYADTAGGKYSHPKGLDWAPGQPAYDPDGIMKKPGFKVFHIQDIDFRSNCATFKQCLQELKRWSDAHPGHRPIFITMNAKDELVKRPGFTIPDKFTPGIYDKLDKEIADNLGLAHVITPDKIRGNYKTLDEAVLHQNWPTLKEAKGKFIFLLDESEPKLSEYIKGHPSLKGRVLFTNSEPGTPEAAIYVLNDAKKDFAQISALVKKGYIIRTRADSDTQEARNNDKRTFNAAMLSGAQIISTDYYKKSEHFKSDYIISFADGKYFRWNPLFSPSK
ncbi:MULTISPECIES: phosphatidylinositol-specific phospholipase C1-like protein [unclassified Mucilaginibacter]|uniref:phosphatidylinositol-specific phospholipase C1-like protein n=1 Tax=unclassified Mucilaginibacter TaxID=2617802 RepID=UPI002AC953D9|nr:MULTISPECIES: phosphatidylinositol-specific phospholipase C1-like protein [unclassified Mucilaginibacter]MEB0261584.1 phosphatidylinositol-specific phospholipase C1-like protein [Mucilaginibacter sp. 10I4]MEB0277163.1 phosphatidylinositol-specific phospholipase C1-like protein [Mucilaginibacter sp. 10B2]MEB0300810.1 phosphatidylinositol-specific phospholipase C1-like protein [Mucilaginibacter sp. 5C4]WPX25262.1 phosphatidylinositol-specific phospholipase C1-like protein [Mucilaginibacter sp.